MKRFTGFLLMAILLLGSLPFAALAANNEPVLTSIEHTSAIDAAMITGNSAMLTVPNSFTGTVDLSNGLDIHYDTAAYKFVSAAFPAGALATVGGDLVLMRVTYQKANDTGDYTTDYSIRVVRQEVTAPEFTGTIAKTLSQPGTITFTMADFTSKYTKNNGADLAYVVIMGSNPSFGTLMSGNAKYNFGYALPVSSLANLTFDATGSGTVSYVAKAYAAGDTANPIGSVNIAISVSEIETVPDVISYTKEKGETIRFRTYNFDSICKKLTGKNLSYVTFALPSVSAGALYVDFNSTTVTTLPVTSETKLYAGSVPFLSDVKFVPATDFLGTINITYTGYNTEGTSYTGMVHIEYKTDDQGNNGSGHFGDVGKDLSWASKAIDYLFEQGIISGTGPGHYNPNASISRGDFTLMLCRAFNLSADSKGNFSDVDENSYYSEAISAAKELGIAKGARGKFNPNSSLSRQDAMVLIVRALDAAGESIPKGTSADLKRFSDSKKISDYAVDAVAALIKADIIQGYGDKLKPNSSVSRAEMAVILYRILTM